MKTFKLHLIRHGITQGNLDGLYLGCRTDLPLCPEGQAQLKQLKADFYYPQPATVFTSPMKRATETADILFPSAAKKLVIDQLKEADFGIYDGKRMQDLIKQPDFARWMDPTSGFVPEGAEAAKDFHRRCSDTLMKLFEFMIKSGITEAACVTHGGVLMSMLAQKALPQRRPEDWMADPGCGYTLCTDTAMWMRDGLFEATEVLPLGYLDQAEEE